MKRECIAWVPAEIKPVSKHRHGLPPAGFGRYPDILQNLQMTVQAPVPLFFLGREIYQEKCQNQSYGQFNTKSV
jgi:hypothetical protein